MPSLYSPAQYLPACIVEQIIHYTSDMRRITDKDLNTYPDGLGIDQGFFTFLWVCQSWRAVAWSLFHQEAFIQFSHDTEKIGSKMYIFGDTDGHNDFPSLETVVESGAEQLTKTLHLTVPLAEIINGLLVPLVKTGPLAGRVFPSITRVIFTACSDKTSAQEGLQPEVAQNVEEFCELFRAMVPLASDIVFRLDAHSATISESKTDRIFELVAKNTKGLFYTDKSLTSATPHVPRTCNLSALTSLALPDVCPDGENIQIARLSASTLESLCLSITEREHCIKLIQDDIGLPLRYPHLKKLVLKKVPWAPVELPGDFNGTGLVLFPVLEHLECGDRYPYMCDILLRGNNTQMRHLTAPLHSELREDYVLRVAMNPEYFPNLYHINIGPVCGNHNRFEKESQQVLNLISSLSPGFRSLQSPMHLSKGCNHILSLIDNTNVLKSVLLLDLPNMKFTQDGLIGVLGSMPQLVKLRCALEDSRRQPRRHVGKAGVRYLFRRHTLLQKCRLKTLELAWFKPADSEYVAERVLVMAVLLPMLKFVIARDEGECYDIEKHVPELIESRVFKKHEKRLERLQFSAASTCCSVVSQGTSSNIPS